MQHRRFLLFLLPALLALPACAPTWQMPTPQGFVPFAERDALAFITPDGVRLKQRTVPNYPKAELAFWTDALQRHLVARGYLLHGQKCFATTTGLQGCTSEFIAPHGGEDWVLAQTLYVTGDDLQILEAAGPFARYQAVAPALAKAYEGFGAEK